MPNITPDRATASANGMPRISDFLETGQLPDGDYTGSLMTDVVDNTTSKLTVADRGAMVAYLRSVEPLPGP